MRNRKQTTRFWWVLASVGLVSGLMVAIREEPAVRVVVDDKQQTSEQVVVSATVVNDLADSRVVTIEFTLSNHTNAWTESGYSFLGRHVQAYAIPGLTRQRIEAVVPLLRKSRSRVEVSALVIAVEEPHSAAQLPHVPE